MSKWAAGVARGITAWLEGGDLVILIVLVSAVHFASVLAEYDAWPVAIALGVLVDLGIWRTMRHAVRYQGASRGERLARWALAVVMIGISYAYHERYYGDVLLAAPVPFLVAALSWLDARKVTQVRVDSAHVQNNAAHNAAHSASNAAHGRSMAARVEGDARMQAYVCGKCGMQMRSQQAHAAHMRWEHADGRRRDE